MSLINQGTISAQLRTILNSLNLSVEQITRMSTLAKTSITAGEDISSIVSQLQTRMNSASDLESAVLLAIVSSVVSNNSINSVANTASLVSANTSPGSLVFVESEGIPYIKKTDNTWVVLEPTLQPQTILNNALNWGENNNGAIGDGTTTRRPAPTATTGQISDFVSISSGYNNSIAIRANGTAWAWGHNSYGRLGVSDTTNRSSPTLVSGGFTDWVKIDVTDSHSLGLRANGTIWSWGRNNSGGLGHGAIGSAYNRSSPQSVVGGFTDWADVAAGSQFSVGLRRNGTIWSWGSNSAGQLGDGTTTSSASPVSVVGGFTDWTQISSKGAHTLALRGNGALWAWGYNGSGQLGSGNTTTVSSPVSVVGGFTDWIHLAAGSDFSLAIRANGTLWSWGNNTFGKLGSNSTTNRSSPGSVVGGFTDWVQADSGVQHTAALRANGTLWNWGSGGYGRLGDGSYSNFSSPISVSGGFTDWVAVAVGTKNTSGLRGSN